jgi:hypothetical protein
MSKQIIVSDADFVRLCALARILGKRKGKPVEFADVIHYLLNQHAS